MGHELRSDDGVALEHRWDRPRPVGAEWATVVALHPHPLMGGDLHNAVPAALARELPMAGIGVLRVNFRGVGASEGTHDEGRAEVLDVRAAIGAALEHGTEPVVVVGYSFGADVAMACLDDERVAGWVLVAPPCTVVPPEHRAVPAAPVLLLRPRHDQFAPTDEPDLRGGAPVRVEPVEGADHFLAGAARWVAERVEDFVEELRRGG